jgi:hypothetical protein
VRVARHSGKLTLQVAFLALGPEPPLCSEQHARTKQQPRYDQVAGVRRTSTHGGGLLQQRQSGVQGCSAFFWISNRIHHEIWVLHSAVRYVTLNIVTLTLCVNHIGRQVYFSSQTARLTLDPANMVLIRWAFCYPAHPMSDTGSWLAVPHAPHAPHAQTFEYSFGRGRARTFAALGPEGWLVVSPPAALDSADVASLEARGPIAALVAPNAFHHMGMSTWHKRFPAAKLFAPAQSIARVQKQAGISGLSPMGDAKPFCGVALELLDMPHYRTGEALVRLQTDAGWVWHVTDVIFNFPKLPDSIVAKLLFSVLSDSAPGFKLGAPAAWLMMRDKRAVYRWLKDLAEREPPVRIVPSHGPDVVLDAPARQLIELLTKQGRV